MKLSWKAVAFLALFLGAALTAWIVGPFGTREEIPSPENEGRSATPVSTVKGRPSTTSVSEDGGSGGGTRDPLQSYTFHILRWPDDAPIHGAELKCVGIGPGRIANPVSDESGVLNLLNVRPEESSAVEVGADGFEPERLLVGDPKEATLVIRLKPQRGLIGRVVRAGDLPAPSQRVFGVSIEEATNPVRTSRFAGPGAVVGSTGRLRSIEATRETNADGYFYIEPGDLPERGTLWLLASSSRLASERVEVRLPRESTVPLSISVEDSSLLAGKAVDSGGEGIPGMELRFWWDSSAPKPYAVVITDSEGRWRLSRPPRTPLFLKGEKAGFSVAEELTDCAWEDRFLRVEPEQESLDIVLRRVPVLRGKVVNGADGTGVAGAIVWALGSQGTTGAGGSFSISLDSWMEPVAEIDVSVDADGFKPLEDLVVPIISGKWIYELEVPIFEEPR